MTKVLFDLLGHLSDLIAAGNLPVDPGEENQRRERTNAAFLATMAKMPVSTGNQPLLRSDSASIGIYRSASR